MPPAFSRSLSYQRRDKYTIRLKINHLISNAKSDFSEVLDQYLFPFGKN